MIADMSFSFTGDSVDLSSSISMSPSTSPIADLEDDNDDDFKLFNANRMPRSEVDGQVDAQKLDEDSKLEVLRSRLEVMTRERDEARLREAELKIRIRDGKLGEIRSGIELELERVGEFKGILGSLKALLRAGRAKSGPAPA
jgi:hypothetical protein